MNIKKSHGKTNKYINLHHGVREGDPLSPLLIIIAVDILARKLI